jgi:hypothetical protein
MQQRLEVEDSQRRKGGESSERVCAERTDLISQQGAAQTRIEWCSVGYEMLESDTYSEGWNASSGVRTGRSHEVSG